MTEAFVSYKRDDLSRVSRLVEALRANGVQVWWDRDVTPDEPWEATIEQRLLAAKVVIVCWSASAVASENVKAEARRARKDGRLIQVFLDDCEPPLFFGERQGVDLQDWAGNSNDTAFQAVLNAAKAITTGRRPPSGVGYIPRRTRWRTIVATLGVVSASVGIVANFGGARDALCSIAPLRNSCLSWGIAQVQAMDAREATLALISGVWGNQATETEPACVTTIRYSLERRDGAEVIVARRGSYESVGRVVATESGSIFTRTLLPLDEAGTQWQLEAQADLLTLTDNGGVKTALVRCG